MAAPLLTLRGAALTFGGAPLFESVDLTLQDRDRLCLVGRNGCGKSTLLQVIAGEVELDTGLRDVRRGVGIGRLAQDVPAGRATTFGEFVGVDAPAHEVDALLAPLGLNADAAIAGASGGELRRAALARALLGEPELLLLDEPTNHLDITAIEWLEEYLTAYRGAVVVISHDRAFLNQVTRRTAWLDRGSLAVRDIGFDGFEDWQAEVYAAEDAETYRMDKKISAELHWLHRGVTARRSRNMGRLRALHALRDQRRDRVARQAVAKLDVAEGERSANIVIEAQDITKLYNDREIVAPFSTRIRRGDRIAIIGPNGAGKTTLLRILLGELEPDSGHLRRAENLQLIYFDQLRETLDPTATPWQVLCPGGGDMVHVHGRQKHVVGYLGDFLFAENQVRTPIENLSGGERNRLQLARLFARPAQLIALDEPTNDLDMETLDLLQDVVGEYEGTILMVSHDRDFIERLATSTIAVEGDGRIDEYVGGYQDYLRQRRRTAQDKDAKKPVKKAEPKPSRSAKRPARLSYMDQRELDGLPDKIEEIQRLIEGLNERLADPNLYETDPEAFSQSTEALGQAQAELDAAESRWLELEEKREGLGDTPKP